MPPLAPLLIAAAAAAPAPPAIPGMVELVANRPPTVVPAAPAAVSGFLAFRGGGVPPLAAEEIDTRKPLVLEGAFACRTTQPVRITATVEWGDGASGAATVQRDREAPAWLAVPAPLAAVPPANASYGKVVATHEYAAAELYTVRVTFQVTREADGATSTFVRTHRLRVRDPGLAVQPWRFDLESISVSCNDSQACEFPLPLGTRVSTEAVYKFGVSWLAAHTARWEWGDGTSGDGTASSRGGVGRASGTHVYGKGGRYKTKLTLTGRHKDGTQDSRTQTFDVAIADIAIDEITGPSAAVPSGYPVDFQAAFRYGDPKRQRKAKWTWGDGQTSDGELSERAGQGSVFGQHTFGKSGVYKAKLTIADGEAETSAAVEVTVSAPGTVNASGTLPFPAGVFLADPKAAGQAQFSLTARHDGASASGGFRLSGPGFDFQSERIESLAISKAGAHASGTASLNGHRPYSFSVDVWTAPPAEGRPEMHMARVRVHDLARQRAVFDNDVFDGALQPLVGARLHFVAE